jgi:hypothetical protein
MAYKFQSGDATLSGSVTLVDYQDLLFQTDGVSDIGTAAKEASVIYTTRLSASVGISGSAVYANDFYGNGSGITGISSDTLTTTTDNTDTTRYVPFVDQATGQAGETLYIDSAIGMNPYSGSIHLSASINGIQRGRVTFASTKQFVGLSMDEGTAYVGLSADSLPLDISSSNSIALMGGNALSSDSGVWVYPKLIVSDSDENARLTVNGSGLTGLDGDMKVSGTLAGLKTISGSKGLSGLNLTLAGGNWSSAGVMNVDLGAKFASNNVSIHAGGGVGITAALKVSSSISASNSISGLNLVMNGGALTAAGVFTANSSISASAALNGLTWATHGGNLSSNGNLVIDNKIQASSNTFNVWASGLVGIKALQVSGAINVVELTASNSVSGSSIYANNFYGNGSNLSGISADALTVNSFKQNNASVVLKTGMNFATGALGAARTYALPVTPSTGDVVYVKFASMGGFVGTISGSGTQTIDGADTANVNSDYAAVSLTYGSTNKWVIF